MNKTTVFIGFIIFGIIGRWIVIPSISKLKSQQDIIEKNKQSFESCLDDKTCGVNDLFNPYFLRDDQYSKASIYLLDNYEKFLEQDHEKAIFLRALYIEDYNRGIRYFNSLDVKSRNIFGQALFHCTHQKCQKFIDDNYSNLQRRLDEVISLKLSLRLSGKNWKDKSNDLNKIINQLTSSNKADELINIIEIIPNHPKLRSAIESHFLEIKNKLNIKRGVVHLSRYNRGWHDRTYTKILSSNSVEHIEAFVKSMPIDCPQKLSAIYEMIKEIKNEKIWNLAIEQAYYLYLQDSKFAVDNNLDKNKFIQEAKCTSNQNFI